MKLKYKFIINVILISIIMSTFIIPDINIVQAKTATEMASSAVSYANGNGGDDALASPAKKVMNAIITIARVIATGVAVIMLIVLAMKYMIAAPGDRADIKKHAVVYVVGAVVLFATSGILTIIQKFASTI